MYFYYLYAMKKLVRFALLSLTFVLSGTAFGQMPGQPANSFVSGSNWYCKEGFNKSGGQCVSIFANMPNGQPANSFVSGSNWYCKEGFNKSGDQCVSIFANMPNGQPANSFVSGSNWYCKEGFNKSGGQCVSIFANMPNGQPANSFVSGSNWYCKEGFNKSGDQCVSIFANIQKDQNRVEPIAAKSENISVSNLPSCTGFEAIRWSDCFGSSTASNGDKYVGEFKDGKYHGQGTASFADGEKYVGEFKDDKLNGQVIHYSANGSILKSGIFKDGTLVFSQYVDPSSFTRIARSSTLPPIRGGVMSPEEWLASQTNQSAPAVSGAQSVDAERLKSELEKERQRLAEEKRKFEVEKAQREEEKKSSRIAIKGNVTQPDANGDFTITISTGADTASLKIDGDELGGKRDGNYVIKRVARVGEDNSYKITARDVFGNTDSATVTVARQVADSRPAIPRLNPANVKVQRSRDAVAIIIGIENYRRVAKADFANADAKEFYTYASRALGVKPENIKLLVDDGADDIEMLNAFQNWLPLKVNKGKTDVYVFYSGHGYPSQDGKSLYFLPFNVDKQYLDRTSVKQKEIVAALQRAQAKSVTMFIDACYSGQTRNGEVLVAGIKPVFITTEERAYPPEFTVITASAADQFSSASQDLKHGIFSFYLMKALEGDADENNDGRLTSGELQRYLSDMVGRQAMGLNRTQNTQLFGNADRVLMTR